MDKDNSAELADMVSKSSEILFSAETVFPFTLFPDTINIDREKVSIAKRPFFRIARIVSFRIEDTLGVEADVGPFFGSIIVTSRFYDNKPFKVNFLRRRDAMFIKRLLQGFIVAEHRKIDCSHMDKEMLVGILYNLGLDVSD